jgi:glutamate carboxypeptidase
MKKQLQLLEKMVNIDSGTGNAAGMAALGELIARQAAGLGFEFEKLTGADGSGHFYLHRGQGRRVLLLAHLDTVFERGTAAKRPFTIEGDRARGPGVSDCKSGVVTILGALGNLTRAGKVGGAIGCLFNTDEEIGSPGSRRIIEEFVRGSQAVLVVEPADGETITVARKGIGRFRLETFGRTAHSGSGFTEGRNAIWELAHKVVEIGKLTALEQGITLNVGTIRGGTRANVIPDYAVAEVDLRFKVAGSEQSILDRLRQITAVSHIAGVTARLNGGITRPSMECAPGNMHLFQLLRETGKALGMELTTYESGGGSDANFVAAVGTPVVDGVGPMGGGLHTETEYLEIPSLARRIALLTGVLPRLFDSFRVKIRQ